MKDFTDEKKILREEWGENAENVITTCENEQPFGDTFTAFLNNYCTACGGNLCGLILTGVRAVYPRVWEAIPEQMGERAFVCLCAVIKLLGVDTTK